jgi:hypothetical protein
MTGNSSRNKSRKRMRAITINMTMIMFRPNDSVTCVRRAETGVLHKISLLLLPLPLLPLIIHSYFLYDQNVNNVLWKTEKFIWVRLQRIENYFRLCACLPVTFSLASGVSLILVFAFLVVNTVKVKIFGGCGGGTAWPFRYARLLRRMPLFLVLAAQPPNILTTRVSQMKTVKLR